VLHLNTARGESGLVPAAVLQGQLLIELIPLQTKTIDSTIHHGIYFQVME
jgi:hypothetical protein